MTKQCTCKAEHWQPHADTCPAKIERPLLTLENIRSGVVPSDAVAVGFLLGELDRLTRKRDEYKVWWMRDSKNLGTALNELTSEQATNEQQRAQIAQLNERLEVQKGVIANHIEAEREGPASLVGALQNVVHTDPGPVRAAMAVRAVEPTAPVVCRQCGSTDTMPWPTSIRMQDLPAAHESGPDDPPTRY